MLLVALTLAGPVFVVSLSACGTTVLMTFDEAAVPLLLGAFVSEVVEVLEIMFVKVPPLIGGVTVRVKFVTAPLVNAVMVGQVTTPLLLVPPSEALTNSAPVGNTSLTTMF